VTNTCELGHLTPVRRAAVSAAIQTGLMKATINGTVLAEAPESDLILIEGNWYFPPTAVNAELLRESDTPYHCSWKGDCQYWTVIDGDQVYLDRAWSYPSPIQSSLDKVGKDYTDYVAFWKEVDVL
jgi:uncharacterized protein (DUF427 family)